MADSLSPISIRGASLGAFHPAAHTICPGGEARFHDMHARHHLAARCAPRPTINPSSLEVVVLDGGAFEEILSQVIDWVLGMELAHLYEALRQRGDDVLHQVVSQRQGAHLDQLVLCCVTSPARRDSCASRRLRSTSSAAVRAASAAATSSAFRLASSSSAAFLAAISSSEGP